MAEAGETPQDQLRAMLLADFDPRLFTAEKLAAWIAFWGETQGRPTYDEICAGPDAERMKATLALCRTLAAEGGGGLDPVLVMRSLESLCDGLWLGVATDGGGHPGQVSPDQARDIVLTALAAFFPRHFTAPRP